MGERGRTRIGIVGCGHAAVDFHLPGYALHDELQVVAGCDPIPERRKSVGERFGFPTYADYGEMLDKVDVDVVSLLVPPHVMESMCLEAADRGKSILCEKPLGEDNDTAERIARAVEDKGVRL